MTGSHDKRGDVTITWNSQAEFLEAPASASGERRQYLPCTRCGAIEAVALNVVATSCDACAAAAPHHNGPPSDAATATGMYDHE